MKSLIYALILISSTVFSQEKIVATAVSSILLKAGQVVAIDNFGTVFYLNESTFYKVEPQQTLTYSNMQYGNITSADAFNPLKINLFYKNFNTVMILDNRLSELFKIDFNTIQPYKNVTHTATGSDNTLWIFNQDLQQLELFDYKTNKIRATTMPVQANVIDLKSNYNYAWLLTEKFLYCYNYFGSTILKIENDNFTHIAENNGNLIIQNSQSLYFLAKGTDQIRPIQLPQMLINQFLLTNETLYIYTDETLHQFQIKIK